MIQTLADALEKRGYDSLTPVQQAVTAEALADRDLLVSAQTGSGKTVGFGLAIAPTLLNDAGKFGPAEAPLALVIAPTRELALQVQRELTWLYGEAGGIILSCVGGMDARTERRALERGAHVVVATPGRLCDHIDRKNIDLSSVRAVVLDEADEMLDLGFREDLEFILGAAPEDRRTLLFSATVPRGIANLAKRYQKNAERVSVLGEKAQHADIEYLAYVVTKQDAENAVINVLRYYEAQNALVFCNTRAMVNRLTTRFSNRGFAVVALSGELSQTERTHALQAMRDGRAKVCIATDVAARGIDLPRLDLVVHAELPTNGETLLHRSGRTGRAGRKGVSALIVPGNWRRKAERLLQTAKVQAEWTNPPSAEAVAARDEERLLTDPMWSEPIAEDERDFVTRLTEAHDAEAIAAAFLRLSRAQRSAPEELSVINVDAGAARGPERERPPRKPREEFGPSVWFELPKGRADNAEPRWILPMICKAEGITSADIGAIRIGDASTHVQIAEAKVPTLMAALGDGGEIEKGVPLRRADGPPPASAPAPRKPRPGPKPFKPHRPKPEGERADRSDAPRKPRPPRDAAPAEPPREERPPRMEKPAPPLKPREPSPYAKTDYVRPDRPPRKKPDPALFERAAKPDRPARAKLSAAPRADGPATGKARDKPAFTKSRKPKRPANGKDVLRRKGPKGAAKGKPRP